MKLYGFSICPFVERVRILLLEKNIICEEVDVNIRNKPDWFLNLTPEAQVPILEIQDQKGETLFIPESTIICEYLDKLNAPSLYPEEIAQLAYAKVWIERASKLTLDVYAMTLAKDKNEFDDKRILVNKKLLILQQNLGDAIFFHGANFSMIDIAYAPTFLRLSYLSKLYDIQILSDYPKLQNWSASILAKPSVKNAIPKNFPDKFEELLRLKGSCLNRSN